MNSTSKVFTPVIVKEPTLPLYRPPAEPEVVSKPPPQVNDMYLTKEEIEAGTVWKLNVVSDNDQKYEYTLYVYWN